MDHIDGVTGNLGMKAPARCVAVANITLAGLQTIDGVVLAAGDRVLCNGQTSSVDNGVWVASTGSWSRATDCDGARDLVGGTLVYVAGGTLYGNILFSLSGNGVKLPGMDALVFVGATVGAISDAIHAAPEDTTPDDADEVGIWDSATGLLGKFTIANLIAKLAALTATWALSISGNAATATNATNLATATSIGRYYWTNAFSSNATTWSGWADLWVENIVVVNYSLGVFSLILPPAASYPNKLFTIKTVTAAGVNSDSSNITPLDGGAATSVILGGTAGKWARIQSDGAYWVIVAAN